MQVFLQTQLHVIVPFGFVADEKGVQDFAAALMHLMAKSGKDQPEVSELQKVSQETMSLMLRRAFGITSIPQLPVEKVRHLAALVSSNMQDETFLDQAERLYKEKMSYAGTDRLKLVEAHTELQGKLLKKCTCMARHLSLIMYSPKKCMYYCPSKHMINAMLVCIRRAACAVLLERAGASEYPGDPTGRAWIRCASDDNYAR